MATRCPSAFGTPCGTSELAGDAELAWGLARLIEAGVFAQAVQMGEMVPDFTVANWNGSAVELQRLLDGGPLVLLFVLCFEAPGVRHALQTVQDALPVIEATGARAAALSASAPSAARALAEALHITFPIGHDVGSHVASLFGLTYDPPEAHDRWCCRIGVPVQAMLPGQPFLLPATYVVNVDGIAEYAVLEADLRQRVRVPDLLRVLSLLDGRG